MSCALVDAPDLVGHRDLEDWYDIIQAWQETCTSVIDPLEGHIAPQVGAAVLVYFGYPYAHEDDARRAVLAGLSLLTALEPLRTRLAHLPGPDLAVRIGIHTGPVIIGRLGTSLRPAQLATGATPQIATSIQALAWPNTLLISDATARLVQGYVVYQETGQQVLPGTGTSVQLWHVMGLTAAQSRLESVGRECLTPLLGREAEMTSAPRALAACARWRWAGGAAQRGGRDWQIASRRNLTRAGGRQGCPQTILRCSPYHTHSALFPVLVLSAAARLSPP